MVGVRKDYKSDKSINVDKAEIPIKNLTYGMLKHTNLDYITVEGKKIEIKGNWIGFILFMLDSVIGRYPDSYSTKLMRFGVTSQTFIVGKVYGKYSFDKEKQYKVYKVFDKDIFVESLFNIEDLFPAMIGLVQICGYTTDEFYIGISNKEDIKEIEDFDSLDTGESFELIYNIAELKKRGWHIKEVLIFGERLKTGNFEDILESFCNGLISLQGEDIISKLPKSRVIGIEKTGNRKSVKYKELKDSEYKIYSNGKEEVIIKYIQKIIGILELNPSVIRFKACKPLER